MFGSSFYGYSFDGKRVQGETQKTANRSRVLIGQIDERTNGNLSTIFAYVTPVDTLPEATYGGPRLRAVDKQGAAIVDIDGQPFYIYPGSHWERTTATQDGSCPATRTDTLTNYGLLRNEQIVVDYWDGVTSRPFKPGAPQSAPVAIPCETYQPLGEKGTVYDIEIGEDGAVWVAASSDIEIGKDGVARPTAEINGVARLDPQSDTWTAFGEADGLPPGGVRFVTPDRNGTAWLGFWDGPLYYFDGERWERFAGSQDFRADDVNAVSIAPDGSMWFAAKDGAYHWDRKTDMWKHYTEADGFHSGGALDILFTPDGKVWFPSYHEVSYLAKTDLPDGAEEWWSGDSIKATTQDYDPATTSEDGKLWLAGQRYFDPATQSWVDTVYRDRYPNDIAVDSRGGLWIARDRGVIYIPDPDHSPQRSGRFSRPQTAWTRTTSNGWLLAMMVRSGLAPPRPQPSAGVASVSEPGLPLMTDRSCHRLDPPLRFGRTAFLKAA